MASRGGFAAPNNSMCARERFAFHGPNGSLYAQTKNWLFVELEAGIRGD
jgi:hypothetical protein